MGGGIEFLQAELCVAVIGHFIIDRLKHPQCRSHGPVPSHRNTTAVHLAVDLLLFSPSCLYADEAVQLAKNKTPAAVVVVVIDLQLLGMLYTGKSSLVDGFLPGIDPACITETRTESIGIQHHSHGTLVTVKDPGLLKDFTLCQQADSRQQQHTCDQDDSLHNAF